MISQPDAHILRQILAETRTIAVVGASDKPTRPSNEIYSYLIATGQYQVFPVNPTITEIDGARVYSRLADLPVVPDMVETLALRTMGLVAGKVGVPVMVRPERAVPTAMG